MISKERLLNIFMELARKDSPSFGEKQIANVVMGHLNYLKLDYYEDDTSTKINGDTGNIICKIKGNKDFPPIALLAHMDTVTPCINKNPKIENDIIRTDGTTILGADDHAGVAAILEVLYALSENNIEHGDITAIFTVAEEKGLLGAKNLDFSNINAKYAFVLDDSGPIGTVTYQAPSQNSIKIVIRGKAAHAGVEPEKGISAIEVFANAVSNMKLGRIDEYTTANIGIVNAGNATNIVCDYLEAFCEARSINEESLEKQIEHMKSCLDEAVKKFGVEADFISSRMYGSYCIDKNHNIINIVKKATSNASLYLSLVKSGGGSDTNILNSAGIPSINLSVGMQKVHTTDEFINVNDFLKSAELLLEIVKCCND
jgi:tripeptide aminopeptidase